MRYQFMTVGDGDQDYFDPFSWDPPKDTELSSVPYSMNLTDLYKPDIMVVRFLENYDLADLLYEFNGLDWFPGQNLSMRELINWDAAQTPNNLALLMERLKIPLMIPDPAELRSWILRNRR